LEERLYLIGPRGAPHKALAAKVKLTELKDFQLILPSNTHGLRRTLDAALSPSRLHRLLPIEIDSLAMLMDAVRAGIGHTIQPGAALARFPDAPDGFQYAEVADARLRRFNSLCSLSDDELSPAALAARVVLVDCTHRLVKEGKWMGARLTHQEA